MTTESATSFMRRGPSNIHEHLAPQVSPPMQHPGAQGVPPEVPLPDVQLRKMLDQSLLAALTAQRESVEVTARLEAQRVQAAAVTEALEAERLKTANFAQLLETFTKEREEREQKEREERDRKEREERERKEAPPGSACAACGKAPTLSHFTYPCAIQLCANYAHPEPPCGIKNKNGSHTCYSCFVAICNMTYNGAEHVPNSSGTGAPDPVTDLTDLPDDSESVGHLDGNSEALPRGAKYSFTGLISTPKSSDNWYTTLQMRKKDPIRQGTITADGVQLHAFASTTASRKVVNVAMITPTDPDAERTAATVMISWLNLKPQSLDVSKCARYKMPREVNAALNTPTLMRPRSNPFTSLTSANKKVHANSKTGKGQKRQAAKGVLSGDECEDDTSHSDAEGGGPKKQLLQQEQEIRELRKKVKQLDEAAAAAAAASKSSTRSASKTAETNQLDQHNGQLTLLAFTVLCPCY